VNKLSDVFRYILQSDKKGLVRLEDELEFVHAFRYMMEVRFANKLIFDIDVEDDHLNLKIPVLSILPLIDNVVVHNMIDSQHKMKVKIYLNKQVELVVSNPVYPKSGPGYWAHNTPGLCGYSNQDKEPPTAARLWCRSRDFPGAADRNDREL
jgi:sensor histidine kinase YesM